MMTVCSADYLFDMAKTIHSVAGSDGRHCMVKLARDIVTTSKNYGVTVSDVCRERFEDWNDTKWEIESLSPEQVESIAVAAVVLWVE